MIEARRFSAEALDMMTMAHKIHANAEVCMVYFNLAAFIVYTRLAWAGGTFFLVVLYVVSVFGSGGKKILVQFWFKYVFTT